MNFDLDDEQRAFAEGARGFYTASASPADVRRALDTTSDGPVPGPAPGLAALADVGFYGITVAAAAGGAGRTVLDLAVVAEQAGRVLAGPSLVTAARASVLLDGDHERSAALADGSTAYAVIDGDAAASAPALDAASAGRFLALVEGRLVEGDGEVSAGAPLDPSRGLATVALRDAQPVVDDAVERWCRAERVARVILAAEDLGTAARAVEMGVEYAKMREAFGRPIGSYQAIKHALVDAYVGVEQLRSLVWWAAWSADESPSDLALASAAVAAYAAQVVERVTTTLIQVHGGIGFTWEHDAHLFWRRAQVDRLLLGDEATLLDDVALLALA